MFRLCVREVQEPNASSIQKQQQFFGIVRAIQKGEQAPTTPETAKAAADMKKSDVKKFASTKHKGLPNKVVQKEGLDKNG